MRIAIGCFAQESHSFSPVPGSWAHFGPHELLAAKSVVDQFTGTKTELGGALEIARQEGVDVVPLLSARSSASAGEMLREVFEAIRDELVSLLNKVGPLDGVLMVLHGAMAAEGYPDATGEVLRALRAALGRELPLVGTLDLHANVTEPMVSHATALVGYHTAPHVDLYETGERGIRLLIRTIGRQVLPAAALRQLPMILPAENGRTTEGPFAEVMAQVKELLRRPGILDASAFSVQPWLDVYEVGCSILVYADGDRALAEREADRLAEEFWKRRSRFEIDLTSTTAAIERALASERRPFVLSDSADAPSSGAPGDSTAVLEALLRARPEKDCYINIVDPAAVDAIARAGVGQQVTLKIGAAFASRMYSPIQVTGTVKLLSDGEFIQKGPGSTGAVYHRGRTGVLKIGRVFLVVMERPVIQWDPELYRSVGLEPRDAQIVVVKSPAAFRAAYAPLAAEILILDAPGICSPNLKSFPFRRVRRPLYPLDDPQSWRR